MSYRDTVKNQLVIDEGLRLKPYKDSVGKLTIGVGRNLDDIGISETEAEMLLDNDIGTAEIAARNLFPPFDELTENRKAVLLNMAFNLGQTRLAGFKQFFNDLNAGHYQDAGNAMLNSLWARQVGQRAQRLAKLMCDG